MGLDWLTLIFSLILSYLIGSIPFAYIIAYKKKGVNIWLVGEGNVGARNVWHVVGPFWGAVTAVLDASKGVAAYLIATHNTGVSPFLFGLTAVLGHQYPLYLKGKGGKGAATFMGFLLALYPIPVLLSVFIYFVLVGITKNFHLAISVAMSSIPLLWFPLFKIPFRESLYTVLFMSILGIKRVIDDRHMKEIKKRGLFWTL